MTKSYVGPLISAVLCAMCYCTSGVADSESKDILELLQAHDAQFDNLHLTLGRAEEVELVSAQAHSYKFDGKIPPGDPRSHRVTASIDFEDEIIVRFPEITSIVKTKEDKLHTLPDGGKVRLSPYSKQSNVKGRHQLLNVAESKDNLEGASMLHISAVNGLMDSTQRKWEETELACGFGRVKKLL